MLSLALSVLSLVATINAHGHIATIIADGTEYPGGIPSGASPNAVGWKAANQDNGFVLSSDMNSPDIICHKSATPVASAATVAAGSSVTLVWNTWPDSHHGPIIDYIAATSGDFASVNKESLQFAKIAESGLISGSNPGRWATEELLANGLAHTVQIPISLAPGNYILRHEILALHEANQAGKCQAYPQCINLIVTGSGTATPNGVPGTSLYSAEDPGILFNLYTEFSSYPIPGPAISL